MKQAATIALGCLLSLLIGLTARAEIITFDDLPSLPPATTPRTLADSNNASSVYRGVTWDSRMVIVGDEYRVDTTTPGPLYGIPHSGHYFITNSGDGPGNNGILLTTDKVLLGAWFGQNEYYGYGTGATQVTINALSGLTVLGSVVFDIPAPAVAGQPGAMGYADTSSFAGLSGITGYRIDRRAAGDPQYTGNWTADDFTFVSPVPEPSSIVVMGLGLAAVNGWMRRKTVPERAA